MSPIFRNLGKIPEETARFTKSRGCERVKDVLLAPVSQNTGMKIYKQ